MRITTHITGIEPQIAALFESTFTAADGAAEGARIATVVDSLMSTAPISDLCPFFAFEKDTLVAGLFFSRLVFPNDGRIVFILSPVAVKTDHQRRGIGQNLIAHGLSTLKTNGASAAVTYGDPSYYCKTGFRPITVTDVPSPFPLNQPEGWLGQSLTSDPVLRFSGKPTCVNALTLPEIW